MHRVMNKPLLFIIRLAQTENPLRPLNNTNVFPRLSEVHFLPCLCLKPPDGVRELERRTGEGGGGCLPRERGTATQKNHNRRGGVA